MKFFPTVQIKPFQDCVAGELVRFSHRNSRLGIVAINKDGARYAIHLQDVAGNVQPVYYLRTDDQSLEQEVISYGSDYQVDVDHSEYFEFGSQNFAASGLLYLHKSDWFMLVAPPTSHGDTSYGYYNFSSGSFGRGPQDHTSARFGKWALSLPMADPMKRLMVLNFEIPPQG